MSGVFSVAWLNLREAADLRARGKTLRDKAQQWLGIGPLAGSISPHEAIVVDLGAGTGSTLRALSAPGSQQLVWRLVDSDGDLLDEALRRHGRDYRIEDYQNDLAVIGELPLGGARLVTASALFDLLSAALVDTLVARLQAQCKSWPIGLYAALNYDGTTAWSPPHAYDAAVLAAFNRDQRRDKGTGPALGPDSGDYLVKVLQQAGFTVHSAHSPWQLGPAEADMVEELINGITAAVGVDPELDVAALQQWQQFRLAHATTGTCMVGHIDVLALP
jgi:hypothetical protein